MSAPPAHRLLPRRDFILLPALSFLTVLCMLSGAEVAARTFWPFQEWDVCQALEPTTGMIKFKPNCHSVTKVAEGPWVDNLYNDCGYRTRASCRKPPDGTIRVAVLGTSFSYGFMTEYQDAHTTLVGDELSRRCNRQVEFQNLGMPNYNLLQVYRRTDEALALHPDVLLLSINPIDVRHDIDAAELSRRNIPPNPPKPGYVPPLEEAWIVRTFRALRVGSRALFMAQHALYQNPDTYLNLYLLYGDTKAGYVNAELSPFWRQRFADFDAILADISAKAGKAGVPLAMFLGPQPAQVALLNAQPRSGFDPYVFGRTVKALAAKYGIRVIDPLPAMAGRQDPMSLYYVVDGHLEKSGQRILAQQLESGLLAGGYPAFSGCSTPSIHSSSARAQ